MDSKEKQRQQVDELLDALKEWDQSADGITDNTGYPPHIPNITLSSTGYSNTTIAANGPYTYSAGTGITSPTWATQSSGTVQAKDFILDGVSIKQILEERLNVLIPNPELEKEWSQLKELGDKYREVEADLIEKAKIWKALKK